MEPRHDPIALTVQILILVALLWIGVGISDLASAEESGGGDQRSAEIDRLTQAIEALANRESSATPAIQAGDIATRTDPPADGPTIADLRKDLAEVRTAIRAPQPANVQGSPSRTATVAVEAAMPAIASKQILDWYRRFHKSGPVESQRARNEMMFEDHATVLRVFGKPKSVSIDSRGRETWSLAGDADTVLRIIFYRGHVIRIY
jgi:hypothetical protein